MLFHTLTHLALELELQLQHRLLLVLVLLLLRLPVLLLLLPLPPQVEWLLQVVAPPLLVELQLCCLQMWQLQQLRLQV